HNNHCAPDRARFISRCFELRVKAGDRTRLLDVERLPCGRAGSTVDEKNAMCAIARCERVRTRGADIAGAKDGNGWHVPVLYSTGSMAALSGKTAIVTGGSRGIGRA